jgi:hypothetical protein
MTTGTTMHATLPPAMGLPPIHGEKVWLAQQQAGQQPVGPRRGGRKQPHLPAHHIAWFAIGLVAPGPRTQVAETAKRIATLRSQDGYFIDAFAAVLDRLTENDDRYTEIAIIEAGDSISACIEEGVRGEPGWRRRWFEESLFPAETSAIGMQRHTMILGPALKVMADMVADTKAHERAAGTEQNTALLRDGYSNRSEPEELTENATPASDGTGPAYVVASQPRANSVASDTLAGFQDNDLDEREQRSISSKSIGSPHETGPEPSQTEAKPSWQRSVFRTRCVA